MYLPNPGLYKQDFPFAKNFLDFNKQEELFYYNLYLDDYKIVIKIPLIHDEDLKDEIKFEQFHLSNNMFLASF